MLEEFAEGLLELAQLLGISAAENNLNAMQDPAMGKAILLYCPCAQIFLLASVYLTVLSFKHASSHLLPCFQHCLNYIWNIVRYFLGVSFWLDLESQA